MPANLLPPTTAHRPPPGNRRRTLLITALAVAVGLAMVAVVVVRATSGPGPRDVVADFFAALAAHDPTRMPAGPCRNNPLCVTGALNTGYQPPNDVTVDENTGTGDIRHVTVAYTLDGHRTTTTVEVQGTPHGLFGSRFWSITTPPGAHLTIPDQTPAPITIAATRLPTAQPDQTTVLWVPPGRYTLTRPATPLLTAAQTTITSTSGPITITMPNTIEPTVTATVQQLIRDRITACATQKRFNPAVGPPSTTWHSCPITYEDRYTISTDPTWTITSYPQLNLEPADNGAINVTTAQPGQATIQFQWTLDLAEPRTWTDVTDTMAINITGQITTANGQLDWTPA
ncbi:hypothetical protein [Dactylosporangium salmoneum]|uniref:hypothetical protein n=1 Tax=Dactylosporangium salmoneum TaxID=53361 RepID=UPI0031E30628